ncbi:MAG: hypothetical protein GY795_00890 [Desulfobacterales bacterium]|nr:hypothetical protein [Desulfobacterales bacterium]
MATKTNNSGLFPQISKIRLLSTIILIIALSCFSATRPALCSEKQKRYPVKTHVSFSQVEGNEIDNTDISVEYKEYAIGFEWLVFLFDFDHREYDWGSNTEPWESLTRLSPGLQYYHEFNDKWGLWLKMSAIAGVEDEITSKSWTYNPQVVGFYNYSKQMSIYGGTGLLQHTVDSIVYPVLGVAWNLNSKSGLSCAVGVPNSMVRYGFNEKTALKMEFQMDTRFYHFAEDNSLFAEGYLKTNDFIPGLYFEYEPLDGLTLSLGARYYFERELVYYNKNEVEISTNDVDGAWSYLFGINYTY